MVRIRALSFIGSYMNSRWPEIHSQGILKAKIFLGEAPQTPPLGENTPPTPTPAPLALSFAPSLRSGTPQAALRAAFFGSATLKMSGTALNVINCRVGDEPSTVVVGEEKAAGS